MSPYLQTIGEWRREGGREEGSEGKKGEREAEKREGGKKKV